MNGTVVFTTSAHEFNQLLNDANYRDTLEIEVMALKSEVQALKQHLVFIGKEVYESDGKCSVWNKASNVQEANDALKYAKELADKESK